MVEIDGAAIAVTFRRIPLDVDAIIVRAQACGMRLVGGNVAAPIAVPAATDPVSRRPYQRVVRISVWKDAGTSEAGYTYTATDHHLHLWLTVGAAGSTRSDRLPGALPKAPPPHVP